VEVKDERGTRDKIKGRIKEAAGALLDDKKLKREGQADQFVGKVKGAAEKVVDKAKEQGRASK
jgi:uncharacterized protein YjbJ (UPF0337 family)